ncbi:hemin uptake protein HemP [Salmonella enterica subsp. enterica serovar Typhi]|nr:hemin uptake protein HemP [Salmonella enterica subsp. enterica]EBU7498057.1 hemin uptake protein HemP [Salmonella enterica subsp. enterica serovar Typhi]EBY6940160.1 hemin uptake protein HemP [Salmonella enterica subsp. enterica serovar Newport]ECD4520229.1 hemin uptake protein HemP [Salmonella enterica subsp. enterica serovar Virchow]EFG6100863.1 hemin uptake protein HemP [Escherichia coli]
MNSYNPDLHRRLSSVSLDRRVDDARIHYVHPAQVRTLSSASLFERGEHEIGIAHGESLYRLKITRQGKLILNK